MYILFVTYFDRYALCIFMQFFRAKSLDSSDKLYFSTQAKIAWNSGAKIASGAKHVAICETCSRPIKQYVSRFC